MIYAAYPRYRNSSEADEERTFEKFPAFGPDELDGSDKNNNIFLYGEINEQSVLKVRKKIHSKIIDYRKYLIENGLSLDLEEKFHINLFINSPGGFVFDAFNLYDFIKRSPIPVHTWVDGFCASGASIVSVAGKRRFMTSNSMIMIHQIRSWFIGKYHEFQDEKENLDLLMSKIEQIYMDTTKLKNHILTDLLKRDIYLDSAKCLEYGFVDQIV